MNTKRYIAILLCAALVITVTACTKAKNNTEPAQATAPATAYQAVTDAAGQAVTTPQGEAVTETVSESAAETSASVSATSSTSAAVSVKDEGVSQAKTTAAQSTTKKKTGKKETTTAGEEEITYIDIVLQKNRKAKCTSPNVSLSTGEITIEKAGDYRITSTTDDWHGKIVVKLPNTEKAELRFENVNISNNTNSIVQIIDTSIKTSRSFLESESVTAEDEIKEVSEFDQAPNVQLSFPEGTSSSFTSTANSVTGVLYNESKLTIKGHGKALFASTKNANNCICSTKSIKIRNVSLSLTTAQNENTSTLASNTGSARGIYSYSKVTLESGALNIKTNGDAMRCDEFVCESGTATLRSSACDGIDADDAIVINGGTVNAIAPEKYCFKVRRINNTEKGAEKGVRAGKGDTFAINGGTVTGEGKKITTVQAVSKQPSITCKIVKPSRGTEAATNESKVPAVITIKDLAKSSGTCTKFLYSSSKVTKGKEYTASANGKNAKTKWNGSVAVADIESTNNR